MPTWQKVLEAGGLGGVASANVDTPRSADQYSHRFAIRVAIEFEDGYFPYLFASAFDEVVVLRYLLCFDGDMVAFSAGQREMIHLFYEVDGLMFAGDITEYSIDRAHVDRLTDESLSLYGQQLKFSLEA
jgi:hypothetical protein